ncbi:hypothetical protein CN481_24650 [Bacillus sp. AFS006103]|nr:hypothetical protein CN481_24650 [Bacillus sp. AFS006103]
MFKRKMLSAFFGVLLIISTFQILYMNKPEIHGGFPLFFNHHIVGDEKNEEDLNPRDFGAVGDGIADDTVALQAWLDAPGIEKDLGNGSYKITSGLISSNVGVTIKSKRGVILAYRPNIIMLTVEGGNSQVSIELDGNNQATGGILIKSAGCKVNKSMIKNIFGGNQTAFGIKSQSPRGIRIENNTIKNIHGTANGKFGDNIGASRAILVTSKVNSTEMNIVKNNTIVGVTGEEGDGIQFLFNDGSFPFLNAKGVILNNTIKDINRRAIKVQASNVKVLNNTHINNLTIDELPNAANLIDVIHSNDIVVQNNTLDARLFLGIKLSGDSNNRASRIIVKGNKIRGGHTLSSRNRAATNGINWDFVQDSEILYNSISDSVFPISGSNGTNIIIDNNLFWGDGLNPAINILSSNSKISVANNKQISGKRSYLIINNASN